MIEIDREITQDFARAIGLEWLETNGLGGWAGTTVAGAHSRRWHGLLVAAAEPRTVLLSKLDETLHVGGESFELSCNQFPGAIVPRGFEHLTAFRKDLFPVFKAPSKSSLAGSSALGRVLLLSWIEEQLHGRGSQSGLQTGLWTLVRDSK